MRLSGTQITWLLISDGRRPVYRGGDFLLGRASVSLCLDPSGQVKVFR